MFVDSHCHAWEYWPYQPVVQALYKRFGPERLHWGLDYSVARRAMTYQQALEAVRTHCAFISAPDLDRILGGSLYDLLQRHGVH